MLSTPRSQKTKWLEKLVSGTNILSSSNKKTGQTNDVDQKYLSSCVFALINHLAYSLLEHSSSALTSSSMICIL